MKSFFASLRSLVLPFGATTGTRIVLDGVNGLIQVYNAANTLVLQIDGSTVLETFSATGLQSSVTLHDGEVDIFPSHIAAANLIAASLVAINTTTGPVLTVTSPQQTDTAPTTTAVIRLQGANSTSNRSLASFGADIAQLSGFNGSLVAAGSDQLGTGGVVIVGLLGGSQINVDTSLSGPNTIDFLTGQLTYAGVRAFLLTDTDVFPCSAALTLGGASAPIVGCAHTYAVKAGTKWKATLTTDAIISNTFANIVTIGQLVVDGVTQTAQALYSNGNTAIAARSTVSQHYSGVFAAGGNLAFQARGLFSGAGGVQQFGTVHTTLAVDIYQ